MDTRAVRFWCGGTKPGIVAVLLSSLIRGFIFEAETSSLSRVLYELVFLTFAILMIWVRRKKEALEVAVADQKARRRENWIWREGPAVLLMTPKPVPSSVFEGNPKFTILKMLKNSARNCRTAHSAPPRPMGVFLIKAISYC